MTVLDVAKNIASLIGVGNVTQVFGSTNSTMVQLQACINRTAEAIRDEFNWQSLQKPATISGDGSAEDFALPADFKRMLVNARIWRTDMPNWPMQQIATSEQWLELETQAFTNPWGQWVIFGDRLHVRPTMSAGKTAKYMYLSNWIVRPESGNNKPLFTADTDIFVLNERLLELGAVWNWKAGKNQAYAKELQDYETMLGKLMDADPGGKPILSGGNCEERVKLAWPGTVYDAV